MISVNLNDNKIKGKKKGKQDKRKIWKEELMITELKKKKKQDKRKIWKEELMITE